MAENLEQKIDRIGGALVDGFQLLALFIIGATIVWAAAHELWVMILSGRVKLDDILLLFIYLELGAMVGIYFKTDRLPVLFLLYVAVTAMTRFLVIDVKELTADNILVITGSILMLTIAVLVLHVATARFGEVREPKVTKH